ncbi:MAG: hypothetical protein V1836_01395 [Candidatus Aenigmatarchaeota archaeon]
MKGQFTIEFIIAIVSFIVIVVYVMNFVNKEVPLFTAKHASDELRTRAYQISEVLVFDDGDWDSSDPSHIGLSSGYHVLNRTKAQRLNTLCSTEAGYKKILSTLNINTHTTPNQYTDFKSYMISENKCLELFVYDNTGAIVSCPPAGSQTWECISTFAGGATQKYSIVRYAPDTNGNVINITVGVW